MFGNKKVFSARANCSGLSDTFRMSGGSLFHWFGPDTEKTAPTESVSVGARHDQVAVVSRMKSRSMYICND